MHSLKALTILCDVSRLNFVEDGMVYIFYGGSNFPKGNATYSSKCTLTKPCPQKIVSVFSDSITKRNTSTTYINMNQNVSIGHLLNILLSDIKRYRLV